MAGAVLALEADSSQQEIMRRESESKPMLRAGLADRCIHYPACQSQTPSEDSEVLEKFSGIGELPSAEAICDRGQGLSNIVPMQERARHKHGRRVDQ